MSIIKIDLPSYSFERDPLGSYHEGGTFFPFFRSPIKYNTARQMQIDFRMQRWEKEKLATMDEPEESNQPKGD